MMSSLQDRRVGMAHVIEDPRQGSSELHGFGRGVRQGALVERRPPPGPGVVAQ